MREATGEAAYAAGHYAEALAELRAAKRMNGATAYLPIMADCHRALGKPQEALKLAKSPGVANFGPEAKAEMTIVEAGARRDLGQLDAALRTLELAPLMSKSRAPWVVRLRYAYADTLAAAGREQDALAWFHRTLLDRLRRAHRRGGARRGAGEAARLRFPRCLPGQDRPDRARGGWMLRFSGAGVSDVGRVRPHNEDSAFHGPYVAVVADGVGGAAAGEVASATAAYVVAATALARFGDDPVDVLVRGGRGRARQPARRRRRRPRARPAWPRR